MKFCLVGPAHPLRGGIAHYNAVLARELSHRHDVSVISLRKQYPGLLFPGTTQIDSSADAVTVESEPLLWPLRPLSWLRAARRISALSPDLVVVQWWHPFFAPCFGALAARLERRGVRTAFLVHNGRAHERSVMDGMLTRHAFRSVSRFVTHSKADAAALRRVRPEASITVSPHPTYDCFGDEPLPRSKARAALGLEDRETLLFFGYVRRYKGLPVLLRALPRILEERDLQLLVVGEFYHGREQAEKLIARLDLGDRVILVDRYVANEEVRGWFSAADAVVLPYRSASQSGIVQIAYAMRRPVIATRVGGLPEVVEDGETGILVEPDDPRFLVEGVRRFFSLDRRHFQEAIDRRRHRFSWQRMVEALERTAAPEAVAPSPAPAETAPAPDAPHPEATVPAPRRAEPVR